MGIFNFFKKNKGEKKTDEKSDGQGNFVNREELKDTFDTNNLSDRNFIDDLVSYFESKEEVREAYFGFIYNENAGQNQLFLGVDHDGALSDIKNITYFIKQNYYPDTLIHFSSPEDEKHLFEYIKQTSFPFYSKYHQNLIQLKVMKQWFDEGKYKHELAQALRSNSVYTFINEADLQKHLITFPTYGRNQKDFIPIFSSDEMIAKSAIKEIPKGFAIYRLDQGKAIDGHLTGRYLILNPGTPFEVEFMAWNKESPQSLGSSRVTFIRQASGLFT